MMDKKSKETLDQNVKKETDVVESSLQENTGKTKAAMVSNEKIEKTSTVSEGPTTSNENTEAASPVPNENVKTQPESKEKEQPSEIQPKNAANMQKTASAGAESIFDALSSEISLGFGEMINEVDDQGQNLVIREGPDLYQTILQTACGYAIRCSHGKLPLMKLKSHNGYWFPYGYANENEKYSKTIDYVYEIFLSEFKNNNEAPKETEANPSPKDSTKFLTNVQLFTIYRLQIPDGQFVSRYIFLAKWVGGDPALVCCKDTANIRWFSIDTILQESKQQNQHITTKRIIDILWGNEIYLVAPVLQQLHQGKITNFKHPTIVEFTSGEVLKYVNRSASRSNTKNSTSNQMLNLLNEARFLEKDVIKVYSDYVQHNYPAMNMTYCSFAEYCSKFDFLPTDEPNLRQIFKAFCNKNKTLILFNEFLMGLAALDTASISPIRCSYIFKFYDKNSDNFLDEDDFKRMIFDIRDRICMSTAPSDVEADAQRQLMELKILDSKKRIAFDAFIREASVNRIKGLDQLFRSNKPIMECIHTRFLYEYISNKSGKPFAPRLVGTCHKCRPKSYSLAYHAVKLNTLGRIDESKPLINFNCGEIDIELQFKKKACEMQIKHSIEVLFNESSVANRVLSIVRNMVDFNKLARDRKTEISQFVIANLTVDLIIQLCKEVTELFLVEPPVLKLNTPCIVIGDLHGNINDLLTYEKQLWPLAPTANAPNVLFLGDYVDRGDYSIEVISYLFAMKVLAPSKFFLLRGNHEIRSIQRNFTFARECMLKYFYQNGQRVFEEFNSVFDLLPLAGIIDESIFCAHGGIPYSVTKIEDLYKIPMPLPDPENQSKAAWEILWSDPVTDEEYQQVCQFKNQTTDTGYTENLRRSTAYYFTEKALRVFLKNNNLSHVVRAHELEAEGYRFHHSGLLITVFSSSRYCNTNNKSAAVFVSNRENEGFLKVIALET